MEWWLNKTKKIQTLVVPKKLDYNNFTVIDVLILIRRLSKFNLILVAELFYGATYISDMFLLPK